MWIAGVRTAATSVYPDMGALVPLADSGQWAALTTQIRAIGLGHPAREAITLQHLGALTSVQTLHRDQETPGEDPRTLDLLVASGLINQAWDARGQGRSDSVATQTWDLFFGKLNESESLLTRLIAEDPADPRPWFLRLISGRGLELGEGELRRRYERLGELAPGHVPAQLQLLQVLCPKWSGTWEKAFEHARACAASGVGTDGPAVVAVAHFEKATERTDLSEMTAYLRAPEVLPEIRYTAAQSVDHVEYVQDWTWVTARSAFAWCFAVADLDDEAAPHWLALGDRGDELLFGRYPSPDAHVTKRLNASRAKALNGVRA